MRFKDIWTAEDLKRYSAENFDFGTEKDESIRRYIAERPPPLPKRPRAPLFSGAGFLETQIWAKLGSGPSEGGGSWLELDLFWKHFRLYTTPKCPKFSRLRRFWNHLQSIYKGKPAAGGKFCRFGVRKYGFIRGKARRRREKIAILDTQNGDFQRGIAPKMCQNWPKSWI